VEAAAQCNVCPRLPALISSSHAKTRNGTIVQSAVHPTIHALPAINLFHSFFLSAPAMMIHSAAARRAATFWECSSTARSEPGWSSCTRHMQARRHPLYLRHSKFLLLSSSEGELVSRVALGVGGVPLYEKNRKKRSGCHCLPKRYVMTHCMSGTLWWRGD